VEIHNVSTSSTDISFDLTLRGLDAISATLAPEPGTALQLVIALALLGSLRAVRARHAPIAAPAVRGS
jgi:hypothetical protein